MGHSRPIHHNSTGNRSLVLASLSSIMHLGKGKDLVLFSPGTWHVKMQWWVVREGRGIDCRIQLKVEKHHRLFIIQRSIACSAHLGFLLVSKVIKTNR